MMAPKAFKKLICFFITAAIIIGTVLPVLTHCQPLIPTSHNFAHVINSVDKTLYKEEVKLLSNESRFTGYPGFYKAANYIVKVLKESGIQPYGVDYLEWFEVTVPIEKAGWIATDDGLNITAYSLYPNLVNPSPYASEDWDLAIYVGKGEWHDFDGKDVRGKFVIMNFESGLNYLHALMLGAKGVIYIPHTPDSVTRPEAESKLIPTPVYFPRVFVPLEAGGDKLLLKAREAGERGIRVKVRSLITWESVKVANIVGYIKGTDPVKSRKAIVIATYYDAFCVVPSLAYGATDALGTAALLQFARFLARNPPAYSVIIAFLAGHYQGLWGAREFVERHFEKLEDEIIAMASIKLASESSDTAVFAFGSTYTYTHHDVLRRRYAGLVNAIFRRWLLEMRTVLGARFGENFIDAILLSHPPYIAAVTPYDPYLFGFFSPATVFPSIHVMWRTPYLTFDSDPFTVAMLGGGFTFYTLNAFRTYQFSPRDKIDIINFENVWPQIYFIFCTLWAMLNEDITLPTTKRRFSDDWGYVTLKVEVTKYNFLTTYWDLINFTEIPELKGRLLAYISVGGLRFVQKVSDNSTLIIRGLKPYLGGLIEVFAIDDEGRVTWATDSGVWQAPGGKWFVPTSHPYTKKISIFECASIVILYPLNPTLFTFAGVALINDARARAPMLRQNYMQVDMFGIAFVMPEIPSEVTIGMGTGLPLIVLNNASTNYPLGIGYTLSKGSQIVLTPFDIFRQLFYLVNDRYDKIIKLNVIIPSVEYYANLTRVFKSDFEGNMSTLKFSSAFGACILGWAALINWYNILMSSIYQVLASIILFFTINLVFVLLFEKLMLRQQGLRRLTSILVLFALVNVVMYLIHPAYHIATNWPIILLTVTGLAITIALLFLSFQNAYTTAKLIREHLLGKHYLEISQSGLFMESVTFAIESMRKHLLRTILIFIATSVITFATISLASVTSAPVLLSQPLNITMKPSFEGFVVRVRPWGPLLPMIGQAIAYYYNSSCYVAPRAFIYPPSPIVPPIGATSPYLYINLGPKQQTRVYALLVLAPEEAHITDIDKLIIKGKWFTKDDIYAIILTESVAKSLEEEIGKEVEVNSTIKIWGINVKIRGIISDKVYDLVNPDGEPITPIDPTSPIAIPEHIKPRYFVLIPIRFLSKLTPAYALSNIAIKPLEEKAFKLIEDSLPYIINYPIYEHINGKVSAWIARQWISTIGFEFIMIPALIASITILNLFLANVYERRREIHIFTSVGMTPSHVMTFFLTEALTYAIPSIFFGYVAGVFATNIMLLTGVFPRGLYPNYTSVAVAIIILLNLTIVIAAAMYPVQIAAKLAVPSRIRRWTSAEKGPKGDEWDVSYPLVATSRREALAFMNYIKEYMLSASYRDSPFYAESFELSESTSQRGHTITLVAHCRFAPYDLGIKSDVIIEALKKEEEITYVFNLKIRRVEGYRQAWRSTAMLVAADLRKQIISWRSLRPEDRFKYSSS